MDVHDWRRRAEAVIDVGRAPSFSFEGRGPLVIRIGLILLAVLALLSAYYQVNADEVGVVQRFGRYVRTTEPGPHVKFPFVETVTRGDYTMVQALVMLIAGFFIFINFVVDLLYGALDPRIRYR